jgi:homoserine dehydrogenase
MKRVFIIGFGGVGRILAELLVAQRRFLFLVVGVSDSKGFRCDANGINVKEAVELKRMNSSIALPSEEELSWSVLARLKVDLVFDARPFSFSDDHRLILDLLEHGIHVVFTNKAPVALHFSKVQLAAKAGHAQFRFSSCVGGALPSVNLLQRDLRGCKVTRFEAILNVSTNILLRQMEETKCSMEVAIRDLSSCGLLETDPSMDIDGFDSFVVLFWCVVFVS